MLDKRLLLHRPGWRITWRSRRRALRRYYRGTHRLQAADMAHDKLAVLIDADNARPAIVEGLLAEVAK
ncbi:MAG: hypothetical protein ABI386_07365, partial [Rhodanobacter sp.]